MINTEIRLTLLFAGRFSKSFSIYKSSDGEVSKNKTGSYCGSDHELLIAKFRLKLKKAGKMTRPFWYDLNQTPYNYTVEIVYNCDK